MGHSRYIIRHSASLRLAHSKYSQAGDGNTIRGEATGPTDNGTAHESMQEVLMRIIYLPQS